MAVIRLSDNWLARMRDIGCSLKREISGKQYVCAVAMVRARQPEIEGIARRLRKAGILCRTIEPEGGGIRLYCHPHCQTEFDIMFKEVYPHSREGLRAAYFEGKS